MFYISKKEVTSFPFDKLNEFVTDRTNAAVAQMKEDALHLHLKDAKRRVEALYQNREDTYEGDLEADFPFEGVDPSVLQTERLRVRKEATSLWLEKYDAKANGSWLLPQVFSYVSRLPISKDEMGKVDSKKFFQNFGVDSWHKGLYFYLVHPGRGDLVAKQYSPEGRSYSALVPLILAPFKKFDNINYKDWSPEGLNLLVDSALWSAMNVEFDVSAVDPSELLKIREIGLDVKSGTKMGSKRNPVTTHKLYGIGSPYNKLPWLAQAMLFQIWCAHPTNRHPLAVLDWKDWDAVPQDLITSDVIVSEPKLKKAATVNPDDLPWWE